MKFRTKYRFSVYLALTLAAMVLTVDRAESEPIALLFPALVAVAGLFATLVVDRDPDRGLPGSLANPLAVVACGLAYLEYDANPDNNLIIALGHLLIYLQIIKILRAKQPKDDWYLLTLSLVVVVVGSYVGQSDKVGLFLFAWILASLWALILGHLGRELHDAGEGTAASSAGEPYAGLIDFHFLASAAGIALVTLVVGGLIFLALPRRGGQGGSPSANASAMSMTAFTEEVKLGRLGEILESDSVVMTVESFGPGRNRVRPDEDALWRGVTLNSYVNYRWSHEPRDFGERVESSTALMTAQEVAQAGAIQHRIQLEPNGSAVLFAPRPLLRARRVGRGKDPEFGRRDGTLWRTDALHQYYEYDTWTDDGSSGEQRGERVPYARPVRGEKSGREEAYLKSLLGLRGDVRDLNRSRNRFQEELLEIAGPGLAAAGDPQTASGKARALESYLRDSGRFHYSLAMSRARPDLDPVIEFLTIGRKGHCEYFASALALMLRAADVPTRVVNGFKGGDWNELAGTLIVRQKHAHSWVEALVEGPEGRPVWITLDPSPAAEREEVVQQISRGSPFRTFTDFIRYVWVYFVVGYSPDRQQRSLYQPAMDIFRKARDGFEMLREMLRGAFAWVFDFPSVSSFFSLRGFVASVVVMLALVAAYVLLRQAWSWALGLWSGRGQGDDLPPSAAFYKRTLELLARLDLRRAPAETPREFARRAAVLLSGRPGDGDWADLPAVATEAYYALRFGRMEPDPGQIRAIEERLDLLEASLVGKRIAPTAGGERA
ncbi:MAG: DUF3488 and transglutaminase-like domain-containing protein [Isosphaeraceae bacterium]